MGEWLPGKCREADAAGFGEHEELAGCDDAVDVADRGGGCGCGCG